MQQQQDKTTTRQLPVKYRNRRNEEGAFLFGNSIVTEKHRRFVLMAVARMRKYGYSEKFTIIKLAESVGTNETTLKQAFKKITGMAVFRYFQVHRMRWAAQLLLDGVSVEAVSVKTGYSTIGHFSYAFKMVYGLSPARWSVRRACIEHRSKVMPLALPRIFCMENEISVQPGPLAGMLLKSTQVLTHVQQ